MLSRLVIAFLPRSKCLNFMAAITICSDFGAQKIKPDTISTVFKSICHEVMGPNAMILNFLLSSSFNQLAEPEKRFLEINHGGFSDSVNNQSINQVTCWLCNLGLVLASLSLNRKQ